MKNTLIPGDVLWVNKLKYGPKLPLSPYEIPWISIVYWYSSGKNIDSGSGQWEYKRLKGFSTPEVNDIIVFTKPGTDEVFIKRCIATPGDTLEIRKGIVYINGAPNKEAPDIIMDSGSTPKWKVYPGSEGLSWDIDNWGPMIIPYKGMQLNIDKSAMLHYSKLLTDRERVLISGDLEEDITNGTQYIFKNDYYFMAGDNRHGSHDSRFFGPVPEQEIIGRATIYIFSKKRIGERGWRLFRRLE